MKRLLLSPSAVRRSRGESGRTRVLGFSAGLGVLVCALFLLGLMPATAAPKTKIKLATLAPTGSSFHKALMEMGEAWKKASGGSVELVVYADGKLGGESDTVGLISVGSIQAALFTAVGLSDIEPRVTGLQSIPMGFRSLEEVDHVGAKLQPRLEQSLAEKGFVTLFWVDAGFIHFFSKKPVNTPDDLRELKFFAWAGSEDGLAVYRLAGFNVVPLETADIIPSLQTGLIEAAPAPPVYALAVQMDRVAPHMLELNWAPLVGACVVKKSVWDKIPEATRAELIKAAAEAGRKIQVSGRKENREAIQAMQQRGLTVHQPTPEALVEWVNVCQAAYPNLRGKIVPADIFDEALRLIEEFRKQSGAGQ